MKNILYFSFFSFLLLSIACKKDLLINLDPDTFIFGKACGECSGNCAIFYKIEDGKIFSDLNDFYYAQELKFSDTSLLDESYQSAKSLLEEFPEYFIENPDKTFGCPDCADQCGFYIISYKNGKKTYWNIDTFKSNQPAEIQSYVDKMENIIDQLN